MRNRICLYTVVMFLFASNSIYSQNFENLKIKEDEKYANHLLFRNIFGTFNKTLLFRSREPSRYGTKFPRMTDKYYVLDADSNKVNDVDFMDSSYMPLAFLNNDTIVLKSKQEKDWVFFSLSQNKYIKDIPKNLKALLEKIPSSIDKDEYVCKFEKSLNKMFLFENSYSPIIETYYYDNDRNIVEKREFNIDKFCKSCAVLNAYWVNSNQLILTLFNNEIEIYTYFFYDVTNNQVSKINFFNKYSLLDDCFDNYCLVRFFDSKPYQAAIYEIETKSMTFIPKYQIYAETREYNPLYRLGFVSHNKIARMTTTETDFTSFEIYS